VQSFARTLREVVHDAELREFIRGDSHLSEFFSRPTLPIVNDNVLVDGAEDIRDQCAQRLYRIRCRLVHTKAGPGVFVPIYGEAADLWCDRRLIHYLARKALETTVTLMP